jgi:hypothetical protein
VSTYPPATGQNEFTDVGLKDPYFFPFSSKVFPFAFNQRDGRHFEPVASVPAILPSDICEQPYCTCSEALLREYLWWSHQIKALS